MNRFSTPVSARAGDPLVIAREPIHFSRYAVAVKNGAFEIRHRLFVNDPWDLIADAIARAVSATMIRDLAQSFRRQAEDYFRAATVARELAVRPVLLYYAFLNLAKVFAIVSGDISLASRAHHGVGFPRPKSRAIPGTLILFDNRHKPAVAQQFLQHLNGNHTLLQAPLTFRNLIPQILPGHRLWCYATNNPERFISVDDFQILHSDVTKEIWLRFFVNRSVVEHLGMSEESFLSRTGLASAYEPIIMGASLVSSVPMGFQQRAPDHYVTNPEQALFQVVERMRNSIWETVRIGSPYRKYYVYCTPTSEQKSRMPQMLSNYLLMFALGAATRYYPGYFDELMDSRYGPFFNTFVSESPMQFLYLIASAIIGQEVSKPAII